MPVNIKGLIGVVAAAAATLLLFMVTCRMGVGGDISVLVRTMYLMNHLKN